jgi:acetyl-CoA acetyltransferase family protein
MRMGNGEVIDLMTESLTDVYAKAPMAITAENLAEKYGISREACDLFALQSQTRAKLAAQGGFFRDEIVPWILKSPKGDQTLALDQHMRPETTIEALQKLKPLFKKDGTVTAGTASGIVDGGAAMVVASERRVKAEKWNPIGRLVSYGIVGCDPKLMGIGPVPAIKVALKRAGMTLDQMDAIEVNEAFAAQTLAVAKELELSTDRLNAWGGAISLGHPLAASGTRILMTLLHQLRRSKKRYGLGSACIGGGQGIAIVVEAFH